MVQVSEASGGQVFLLDPSELASSATLLMARDGHDETLRRIVGELDAGLRTVEVAVDPSIDRVLFSVSLQCLQQIEIVRPSGAPVAASDAGVSWTAFQAGRQVGVTAPEPGTWTVNLAGKGLLFLVVHARASLTFDDVRLVRPGGRPGHEGLFRDERPLLPRTRRLMEITLSRGILEPAVEFRSSTDTRLSRLALVAQPGDGDEQTYLSEFDVPTVPFRVVVTGRDHSGKSVQRAQGSLFPLSQTR